ncbi:PREDICTED: ras-related protein RabX-like [Polistes dominula]|uniref:Ras-related protein RabX-like n=1 Tax=Polistes dominula TaxID=743375 RepID=A0ABM1II11_POLDO|nr:PREDICTED: ras-related protein RabX-like [Polistes dominula]
MAQGFNKQFCTGKDSMKYLRRRSKRADTNIKQVKSFDTSMVKSKEDFMNIIGLGMKGSLKKDNVKENNNVIVMKKIKISPLTMLNLKKCSVVIVAERCSICKLPFKCISDVVFHKIMRHGNDPVVNDSFLSNLFTKKQCFNIRRKRLQNTNNNNNLFRLKLRIGEEIISEISMNRKHLKVPNSSSFLPKIKAVKSQKNDDSITFKNDSKSNIVGIDSFDSTRNHYKDYVVDVQPFHRIQTFYDSPLNEDCRQNDCRNRSKLSLDVKNKNLTFSNNETVFSTKLSCVRSLSEDNIINNNNNSNISNNIATFDKENTLNKIQSVKRVCNVNPSLEATEMHLTSCTENENKNKKDDNDDDEEIQEILRITRRRRTNNNNENIRYRLDPPINEDSLLFDPEDELTIMREKRYHTMIYYHNSFRHLIP